MTTQDVLDFEPGKPRYTKSYACPHCHTPHAVHWLEDTQAWTCCACGRVDATRTKREKERQRHQATHDNQPSD